ncbi:protein tyrosine phosphatase [Fibrobacter sp. UWB4]|uniref:tyrosine-protein phosphatase n=1 Tax=Fibrobacter sp. UWB4 TaxID=1964356 RepID=UPI000B680B40|nr:tyrosine-protein phosphatase [Fibrobacter sp. UWB4]OWV19868.1 protein tyrosine phosphatase [Fibrobacter sp. UWB4]
MVGFWVKALDKKMVAFGALAIALFFAACGNDDNGFVSVNPIGGESCAAVEKSSSSTDELVSVSTIIVEDTLEIFAFGGVKLDVVADSFLTKFDYGDVVTVMIAGYDTLDVPVVAGYGYVFPGEFFLYVSEGLNYIKLEARYGQMAEIVGLGRDLKFPIDVVVQMKEKGGYVDHLENLKSLSFAYSPESYPDLSIEEFANFRMVRTTGMGEGVLYRSSSPIDPSIYRNAIADSLAALAGVKTFLNLADDKRYAEEYNGFAESYYATQNVVYLTVDPTFANTLFKDGLVKGLRYMIEHDGPYLVHCTYGMDRTGFTIAVLEALMGATADEIKADYATTHKNFYNVVDGKHIGLTEKQVELLQAIIVRLMQNSFKTAGVDISNFENADLAAATEKYLLALGMEQSEIEALKVRLK